jgi:hypothetical protein
MDRRICTESKLVRLRSELLRIRASTLLDKEKQAVAEIQDALKT